MKNLRLKSARAALDMSQQQLADAVGVSRQTINAIEKGDYNPTIKLSIAICKTLNKTLDELFWEYDSRAAPHRDCPAISDFVKVSLKSSPSGVTVT